MLKRKIGIALCLMAVASFLIPAIASADAWYVCTVAGVGKNAAGELKFSLTDVGGTFTGQSCKLADNSQANQFMAILLTAQVMGVNVGVCTTAAIPSGGQAANGVVTCLYLLE
jgi:Holliday junction resolvasome RuvABC DNA-binding subunit